MKIEDEKLLATFRGPGRCELCGKGCKSREPHHVTAKGMGGGKRLDIRLNILSVGSTPAFECECHTRIDTKAGQERCWRIISEREGVPVETIREVCSFILNLDKDSSPERIQAALADLSVLGGHFAEAALMEAGKL